LAADVAGYSRLMGTDEVGTLEALKTHRREIVDPAIADHNGRIVKTTGDGMLVEFSSAVDAVTCAMAVQGKMAERNEIVIPAITFRIGINVGDIIIDGDDIFGDGVNVAARVENECEPGGVCLSGSAFEQVRGKADFAFGGFAKRHTSKKDTFVEALPLLKKAIELDEGYAQAYAAIAFWYVFLVSYGWSQNREQENAEAIWFARKALDGRLSGAGAGRIHLGPHR
jgi:class 3 adenylate cyclase